MIAYEAIPLNDTDVMNGFISFIKSLKVNNDSVGLLLFKAEFDNQGNIINWVAI